MELTWCSNRTPIWIFLPPSCTSTVCTGGHRGQGDPSMFKERGFWAFSHLGSTCHLMTLVKGGKTQNIDKFTKRYSMWPPPPSSVRKYVDSFKPFLGANEGQAFPVQILGGSPEEYDPWLTDHRPNAVCMHYNRMLSIWRGKMYINQANGAGTFFKGFHGWLSLSRWFFDDSFLSHSVIAALDLAAEL